MIPTAIYFHDLYAHQATMLAVFAVALLGVLLASFWSDR